MSLQTPRGLKIRLPVEYAFALMARLWRVDARTDAFRVLKTCEAIWMVPGVLAFIVGLTGVFLIDSHPAWLLLALPAGRVVGSLLIQFGFVGSLSDIGLVRLAEIVSHFSGYGLLHAGASVALWLNFGWPAVGFWFAGAILAVVGSSMIEVICFRFRHRAIINGRESVADRVIVGSSELYFLHAYRLHANRLGVTKSLAMDPRELEKNPGSDPDWLLCVYDLFGKWPAMAGRFEVPEFNDIGNLAA